MIVTILAIIGGIVVLSIIIAGASGISQFKKMEDETNKASREFYSKLRNVENREISSDDASSLAAHFYQLTLMRVLLDYKDVNVYETVKGRMPTMEVSARMLVLTSNFGGIILALLGDKNNSYQELDRFFNEQEKSCREEIKRFITDMGINLR